MGFGAPAAIGAKLARPDKVVVALVGDGGFGQNPSVVRDRRRGERARRLDRDEQSRLRNDRRVSKWPTTGRPSDAFSTGTASRIHQTSRPSLAAYGADGVQIQSAAEFKPALERAIASNRPFVVDVMMQNEAVPTGGHWNINDIYSPGLNRSHVAVVT